MHPNLGLQFDENGKLIPPDEYITETKALLALRTKWEKCPDPALFAHSEVKEILNLLLPPKEWVDSDSVWEQEVT